MLTTLVTNDTDLCKSLRNYSFSHKQWLFSAELSETKFEGMNEHTMDLPTQNLGV